MGAVFEATDPEGKMVAVKTLLVGPGARATATETRARFEREVDATRRLSHRNVVALLDSGVDETTGAVAFTRSGAFMGFLVGAASVPPIQDTAPWLSPPVARTVHAAILRQPDARWPNLGELELGLTTAAGFPIAHAPLYRASFAPVSAPTRKATAPRAELPQHWEELLRG